MRKNWCRHACVFRYVSGRHYSRTLEAWLRKHDAKRRDVLRIFRGTYGGAGSSGGAAAVVWFNRWRMFYMACSELFAFNKGEEWGVGHYVFSKRA